MYTAHAMLKNSRISETVQTDLGYCSICGVSELDGIYLVRINGVDLSFLDYHFKAAEHFMFPPHKNDAILAQMNIPLDRIKNLLNRLGSARCRQGLTTTTGTGHHFVRPESWPDLNLEQPRAAKQSP